MPTQSRESIRLTQARVTKLPPSDTRYEVWDSELPGFHLRIAPSGRKTYNLFFRLPTGAQRKMKIAASNELSCDEARKIASEYLRQFRSGQDPSEDRKQVHAKSDALITDLCEEFMATRPLKRSTRERYLQLIKHITSQLGNIPGENLSHADCVRLHSNLRESATSANRCVQLLRNIVNRAMEVGRIPERPNPAANVKLNRERPKERFLSTDERERLMGALDTCEATPARRKNSLGSSFCNCIRLMAFTGMRKGEAMGLDWDMVDLPRRQLFLPDSKTGKKTVWLSDDAVSLLEKISTQDRPESGPVLVSRTGSPVRRSWDRSWKSLCSVAELLGSDGKPCLRPHDLRHSYISDAVMAGVPLEAVAQLVGHKSTATTARYRHIANDYLKDAAAKVGDALKRKSQKSGR